MYWLDAVARTQSHLQTQMDGVGGGELLPEYVHSFVLGHVVVVFMTFFM